MTQNEIWNKLCNHYTKDVQLITDLYNEIVKQYSQRERYYHNLNHIESMLKLAKEFKSEISDLRTFYFSIWYHDIVYNPKRNDNEEKSAEFAQDRLSKLHIDEPIQVAVRKNILATKEHSAHFETGNKDLELFLDVDLAILGAERKVYYEYLTQIRREYHLYPNYIFNPNRVAILLKYLEQPSIFRNEKMKERFEAVAKKNIEFEINFLTN
jgi:predicted metal-dependent HD superfamily phosphohydrolase